MKIAGVDYPVRGLWYRYNLDPKYAYERYGSPSAFITNGCGIAFRLHGGTKQEEIVKLCAYLDKLEAQQKRGKRE